MFIVMRKRNILLRVRLQEKYVMFGQIRKEFSPTRAVGIAASEQQLLISSPTESADQRRYGEDNLIARHDIPFAMTSGRSFETEVTTRYVPAENGICKEI